MRTKKRHEIIARRGTSRSSASRPKPAAHLSPLPSHLHPGKRTERLHREGDQVQHRRSAGSLSRCGQGSGGDRHGHSRKTPSRDRPQKAPSPSTRQISEVYHVIDGEATLLTGPDLVNSVKRPTDEKTVRLQEMAQVGVPHSIVNPQSDSPQGRRHDRDSSQGTGPLIYRNPRPHQLYDGADRSR